jgi:hypothetical protein
MANKKKASNNIQILTPNEAKSKSNSENAQPPHVIFDLLDAVILCLRRGSASDPVETFIQGLASYLQNDPFGSQIRLRELLKVFRDSGGSSKHAEYKKLLEVAKKSLASENPLEVVMNGIVELVSANKSLEKGSTEKEKFYKDLVTNHAGFKQHLAAQNLPPPRWLVDAVVLIESLHCLFWMCTTNGVYRDVFEKNGKLHFTKDKRQNTPREFIWSSEPFAQINKKDMAAIFSSDVCEEALTQLAPLVIFILKGENYPSLTTSEILTPHRFLCFSRSSQYHHEIRPSPSL